MDTHTHVGLMRLIQGIGLAGVVGGSLVSGTAPVPGAAEALIGTALYGFGTGFCPRLERRASSYEPRSSYTDTPRND